MNNILDEKFDVEVKINPWSNNSGASVNLDVTNIGENDIRDVAIKFKSDFRIRNGADGLWGAEIVNKTPKNGKYEYILRLTDNTVLEPGEKDSFGFSTLDSTPEFEYISLYSFNTLEEPTVDDTPYEFDVDVKINPWSGNYGANVDLDITNIGENDIRDVAIKFKSDFRIRNGADGLWGAEIVSETPKDEKYEYILRLTDNTVLEPGEKDSFGFSTLDSTPEFEYISLHSFNTLEETPVKEPSVDDSPYEFNVDVKINPWPSKTGASVNLDVTNIGENDIPDVAIKFQSDFRIGNGAKAIWGAEIVSETPKDGKYEYVLNLIDENNTLEAGEKNSFGFNTLDSTPEFEFIRINGADPVEEPTVKKPVVKEHPVKKPVVKEPPVEEPIVEEPVVKKPVVKEPPVKELIVEEPTVEQTSGEVERPAYNKSTGFFTLNGKVYDANGNEFIARGVNNRHVWFDSWGQTPALNALDNIAGFGFNSVRIVWEIDHRDGSLTKDSVLERIIQTTIDNKMVPMVELHDFTGSNNPSELLNKGVKWWTDRAAMWEKYEESLMINIANEFGNWFYARSDREEFPKVYKEAITRIRAAGIDNTLVIDPFEYAKDYTLIAEYGKEIYNHDPQKNVVFSIHFYCDNGENPSKIAEAFDSITGQGLPMIVGEFASTHSPCGDVREDVIMAEAQDHGVGYYPWAWDDTEWTLIGNGNWEADSYDELSKFGKDVIFGPNGIQETSEIATIFE